MANRHFGALGDVWKHLPLGEVLRIAPPLHYWETHAGSALYPLTENVTRGHGAIRFLERAPQDRDLAVCSYLEVLRTVPGQYPGSPVLAMRVLGKRARYLFCDTDPESVWSLRAEGEGLDVCLVLGDGVSAVLHEATKQTVRASDVLVHIDPYDPNERVTPDAMTPIELAAFLARQGYRVFYWYGYDSAEERGWALREIQQLAPEVPLWCGDMIIPSPFVYPGRPGAWGCGVVLANATSAETQACERLGRALERINADDVLPNNEPERQSFAVMG